MSAMLAVGLAASAQTQEALKVKSDGFYFMQKNLTTIGKATPYSTIGTEYSSNQLAEFTVYNESFNKVQNFSYPLRTFEAKSIYMKALADITKKTVIEYWDRWPIELGKGSDFVTFDDFKLFVLQNNADLSSTDFFIDQDGNFAYHMPDKNWMSYEGYKDMDGKDVPVIRQRYYYYNKEEKAIYYCTAIMAVEVDLDHLTWTVDDSQSGSLTRTERIMNTELKDYDIACNEGSSDYITQNVFNDDDKYEFLVKSYRQVDAPTDGNTTLTNGLSIDGMENGKLVIRKQEQDKYYEGYTKVVNEDGKDLLTLPVGDDNYVDLYRLNGKTYIGTEERSNGETTYVLYLLDTASSGITELARTNAVKGMPTYNLQGMKVRKDAKGVVIQRGGKKYINK